MNDAQVDIVLRMQDQATAGMRAALAQMQQQLATANQAMGSFGAASAQTAAGVQRLSENSAKQVAETKRLASATVEVEGEMSALGATLGRIQRSLTAFAFIYALTAGFEALSEAIVGFNSRLETSTLGIATSFLGAGKYIDTATGQALQGQEALAAAQTMAKGLLKDLQNANYSTIATFDQLVRSFQDTLPIAMSKGFNVQQVKDFNTAMVQAAGAIDSSGKLMEQLGEETRALLTGTIRPGQSRIANVLGIRPEDIRQYKDDAAGLFDFLMQKLKPYTEAGVESQKTWGGVFSALKDNLAQWSGEAFKPAFVALKADVQSLLDQMGKFNVETGKMEWNPAFTQGVHEFSESLKGTLETLHTLGAGLVEHRAWVEGVVKAYVGWRLTLLATSAAYGTLATVTGAAGKVGELVDVVAQQKTLAAGLALGQAELKRAEATRIATFETLQETKGLVLYNTVTRQSEVVTDAARRSKAFYVAATQEQILANEYVVAAQALHTRACLAEGAAISTVTRLEKEQAAQATLTGLAVQAAGGWIGAIITLLGLAATAWAIFGQNAEDAADKQKQASEDVQKNLDEELKRLRERNRLSASPNPSGAFTDAEFAELNRLAAERRELIEIMRAQTTAGHAVTQQMAQQFADNTRQVNNILEKRAAIGAETRKIDFVANPPKPTVDDAALKAKKSFEDEQEKLRLAEIVHLTRDWDGSLADVIAGENALAEAARKAAEEARKFWDAQAQARFSETAKLMADFGAGLADVAEAEEAAGKQAKALRDDIARLVDEGYKLRLSDLAQSMADFGNTEDMKPGAIPAALPPEAVPFAQEMGPYSDAWRETQEKNLAAVVEAARKAGENQVAIALWAAERQQALDRQVYEAKTWLVRQTSSLLGQGAEAARQMYESTGRQHKKFFDWYKQLAKAQVIVDSANAIMASWAANSKLGAVGAVLAVAQTALIAAAGAAQLANINAQQPQAHSGMDFVPSTGSYVLKQGELVADPGTSDAVRRNLLNGTSGGASKVTITINQQIGSGADSSIIPVVAAVARQAARGALAEAVNNDPQFRRTVRQLGRG